MAVQAGAVLRRPTLVSWRQLVRGSSSSACVVAALGAWQFELRVSAARRSGVWRPQRRLSAAVSAAWSCCWLAVETTQRRLGISAFALRARKC